jgi:hypothetical protein
MVIWPAVAGVCAEAAKGHHPMTSSDMTTHPNELDEVFDDRHVMVENRMRRAHSRGLKSF